MFDLDELMKELEARKKAKEVQKKDETSIIQGYEKWSWWLGYLARAYTRARRLEALRTAYHRELYDCIRYGVRPFDPLAAPSGSVATDIQAIKIIEKKERYERKIQKEYRLHATWQKILEEYATEKEKIILIRYFQKRKHINRDIISNILNGMNKQLTTLEEEIAHEKWKRARKLC